jgi:hypothetical protein
VSGTRGTDAGGRTDFREEPIEICGALEVVCIARRRKRDVHGKQMLRLKARIDGNKAGKASQHKAGANGEEQGQSHFRDDETAAQGLMAADASTKRALLESILQIHTREPESRNETEKNGSGEGNEKGKEEDAGIDGDGFTARERSSAWDKSEQAVQAELGENKGYDQSRNGEQETLHQQLLDETATRGAECGAHSHLPETAGAAHEKEVGNVCAGNEKKEADGSEKYPKRAANVFGSVREHGDDFGAPAFVEMRTSLDSDVRDASHVLAGLFERETGF